jgi:hypothetical protein
MYVSSSLIYCYHLISGISLGLAQSICLPTVDVLDDASDLTAKILVGVSVNVLVFVLIKHKPIQCRNSLLNIVVAS